MDYSILFGLNYINIIQFLSLRDLKNLILSCKDMYNNKYIRKDIKIKAGYILSNILKKYILIIKSIKIYNHAEIFNKRLNAIYYYRFYDKRYIKSWYNNSCDWKNDILNKEKKKN